MMIDQRSIVIFEKVFSMGIEEVGGRNQIIGLEEGVGGEDVDVAVEVSFGGFSNESKLRVVVIVQ